MLVYQTCIQIYDQISIPRIFSKVKLHHAVSLRFGLNEVKIALNIMKFGMLSYLPNGHINLRSNFNSEKLVKSETPLCCFAKVGLKASENISQCHEISCASFSIKWTSTFMSKFQL